MRYEGFDGDSTRDFWLNLCVPDIHPVGWCAAGGKPLVPPQSKRAASQCLLAVIQLFSLFGLRAGLMVMCFVSAILHRFNNWKTFLIKRLTGCKTLPPDFSSKVPHLCTSVLVSSHGWLNCDAFQTS